MTRGISRRSLLQCAGFGAVVLGSAGTLLAVSAAEVGTPPSDNRRVLLLDDFCEGDGVTDDGPNIQRAVDSLLAQGGGELRFTPGRTYYWNTDVVVSAPDVDVKIVMTGAKVVAGPSAVNILTLTGSREELGGKATFNATQRGDTVLPTPVNLTESLSVGDWIMVWSTDIDNKERPTDYLSGEEAVVVAVTASQIEIDRPLRFTHSQRAQRRLFKFGMTRPTIEGGHFELHNDGERQVGLAVRYALNPRVTDVSVSGKSGRYGVHIDQSIDPKVKNVSGEDIYDAAHGRAPNGVALYLNGIIGGTVDGAKGIRCRHAVDINSYSSRAKPGLVSREMVVNNVEAVETYSPGWTTHHARKVTFNDPVSINCGGGGQIRGYDTTLRRPRVIGGNETKPREWDGPRFVPAGIAFGETDSLPQGEGRAAEKVRIESPVFEDLPDGWSEMSFSDDKGDVVILE